MAQLHSLNYTNIYSGNCGYSLEPEVPRDQYEYQIGGCASLFNHDYKHSSPEQTPASLTVGESTFFRNKDYIRSVVIISLFADIKDSQLLFSNCKLTGNGGSIAILGKLISLTDFPYTNSSNIQVLGMHQSAHSVFKSNVAFSGAWWHMLYLSTSLCKQLWR